jgi:hypothetical protein
MPWKSVEDASAEFPVIERHLPAAMRPRHVRLGRVRAIKIEGSRLRLVFESDAKWLRL